MKQGLSQRSSHITPLALQRFSARGEPEEQPTTIIHTYPQTHHTHACAHTCTNKCRNNWFSKWTMKTMNDWTNEWGTEEWGGWLTEGGGWEMGRSEINELQIKSMKTQLHNGLWIPKISLSPSLSRALCPRGHCFLCPGCPPGTVGLGGIPYTGVFGNI
jgi:hypothetical protein